MSISIRTATMDDLKTLQNLSHELFLSDYRHDKRLVLDWPYSNDGAKYFRQRIKEKAVFLAEDKGTVIGYLAAGMKKKTWRDINLGELDNILVAEDYRGRGVGSQLLEAAGGWWKQKGAERVCVYTYYENKRATRFYEKNGFRRFDLGLELDM